MSMRSFSLDFELGRRVRVTDAVFLARRQKYSRRTGNWCFRENAGFAGLKLQFGRKKKNGTVGSSTRLGSFRRSSHRQSRRRNWIRKRKRMLRD